MAIVTQPLGSAEARGSVGGLTYSTWRGKHIVKARQPDRPDATGEALAMLQLAWDADASWIALTQPERDRWNAWAAQQREPHWTGQDKRLTGHNWYVRIYVRQSLIGGFPDSAIPTTPVTYDMIDLVLSWTVLNLWLNYTVEFFPGWGGHYVQVYCTGPLSAGINATIHMATIAAVAGYGAMPMPLGMVGSGTYTAFVRLINTQGLANSWQSCRLTVV